MSAKSEPKVVIGMSRSGQGTPLVLVHGTAGDHTRWGPLLPALDPRFTVYAIDRRGRGTSGDGVEYSIAGEAEDIAGVIDSIGGPVDVLAHSYGALCTLEASLHAKNLRKLVLYEPPVPAGVELVPPGSIERLQAMLDAGQREELVSTFFLELAKMPESELTMLKSLPNWPARVAAAHTLLRELRAGEAYRFEPSRFASVRVPTLLLLGGESPPFLKAATEIVHAALSTSRVAVMPGQQHIAMNTAPELFLREVTTFLAD
jgi:pimeloyl-ACP methyl ester carboxylesterase